MPGHHLHEVSMLPGQKVWWSKRLQSAALGCYPLSCLQTHPWWWSWLLGNILATSAQSLWRIAGQNLLQVPLDSISPGHNHLPRALPSLAPPDPSHLPQTRDRTLTSPLEQEEAAPHILAEPLSPDAN